mmetsp:Transcript_10553/g.18676  ORF Transcript_10553/g.18676 Transcript_10553/m.18676 type:complete len:254 (-) Transcript_10553:1219-1980(-)
MCTTFSICQASSFAARLGTGFGSAMSTTKLGRVNTESVTFGVGAVSFLSPAMGFAKPATLVKLVAVWSFTATPAAMARTVLGPSRLCFVAPFKSAPSSSAMAGTLPAAYICLFAAFNRTSPPPSVCSALARGASCERLAPRHGTICASGVYSTKPSNRPCPCATFDRTLVRATMLDTKVPTFRHLSTPAFILAYLSPTVSSAKVGATQRGFVAAFSVTTFSSAMGATQLLPYRAFGAALNPTPRSTAVLDAKI